VNHALVTSVSSGILVNAGHLLENLVFTALRRVTPDIFYYKTKGGREVDFIAQIEDRSRLSIFTGFTRENIIFLVIVHQHLISESALTSSVSAFSRTGSTDSNAEKDESKALVNYYSTEAA